MSAFDDQTLDLLRKSGWSEHRSVPISTRIENSRLLFPLARSILVCFDSLKVGTSGPGVDFGASDIEFASETVDDFVSVMDELCVANGRQCCPIGYASKGYLIVVIDEEGAVYTYYDSLVFMGASFEEGIQNILAGREPRRPDTK